MLDGKVYTLLLFSVTKLLHAINIIALAQLSTRSASNLAAASGCHADINVSDASDRLEAEIAFR